MQSTAIRLYERLKEKLGSEDATLLIDFIDERVKGEVATKDDIYGLDKRITEEFLRLDKRIDEEVTRLDKRITDEVTRLDKKITDEVARLDRRITDEVTKLDKKFTEEFTQLNGKVLELDKRIIDMEWKMKLYFVLIGVLIILTNPAVIEFFSRLIGLLK